MAAKTINPEVTLLQNLRHRSRVQDKEPLRVGADIDGKVIPTDFTQPLVE